MCNPQSRALNKIAVSFSGDSKPSLAEEAEDNREAGWSFENTDSSN
jgi:hypothetical protein